MMAGDFAPPAFALDGVSKDVGLITEAASRAGMDTTLLDALAAVYRRASDLGYGKDDLSAVIRTFDAGLIGGPAGAGS